MKKIKVKVGIDKSKLIKSEKKLVACGKEFLKMLNKVVRGYILTTFFT